MTSAPELPRRLPGWAVVVKGEKIDIEDLQRQLPLPFDPWMEEYDGMDDGRVVLLRSMRWASLTEAADVARDADHLLGLLHGAVRLIHHDAKPVRQAGMVKFDEAGERLPFAFAASINLKIKGGRTRGYISTGMSGSPEESATQAWLAQADRAKDDTLTELLVHLGRADDWYELYKAAEIARRLIGSENALRSLLGNDHKEWERCRRMANCMRHAPDPIKFPLPEPPPSFAEAQATILRGIAQVLQGEAIGRSS